MATVRKKKTVKKTVQKTGQQRATPRRSSVKKKAVKTKAKGKRSAGAKKKRSLYTCSGGGYYLKVSKNGSIRKIAGRSLRCLCDDAGRGKCDAKHRRRKR